MTTGDPPIFEIGMCACGGRHCRYCGTEASPFTFTPYVPQQRPPLIVQVPTVLTRIATQLAAQRRPKKIPTRWWR